MSHHPGPLGGGLTIEGGEVSDTISAGRDGTISAAGGGGVDDMRLNAEIVVADGGVDGDKIRVGAKTHLLGGKGRDTIQAEGTAKSYVEGNEERDTLYGSTTADALRGGPGNDYISAARARTHSSATPVSIESTVARGTTRSPAALRGDKLYGEDGTDAISGDAGNDRIYGGPGDDRRRGKCGASLAPPCEAAPGGTRSSAGPMTRSSAKAAKTRSGWRRRPLRRGHEQRQHRMQAALEIERVPGGEPRCRS